MIRRLLAVWAVLSVCLAAGAGCASKPDFVARATRHERAGELELAVAAARQAVAADRGDADARALLGRLEARAGRPGAALREYDAAVALGDDDVRAELAALYAARGQARARLGHRARFADLDRAAQLDPGRAGGLLEARRQARVDAGLSRWAGGDVEGALRLWAQAPGRHPMVVEEVVADPERAPLVLVGAIAARAHEVGGAGAWPLLDAYARRGGDDARVLAAVAAARRRRDVAAPAPGFAAAAGESGAAALAAALAWRGSTPLAPEVVAAVLELAARAWLYGERDAPLDDELAAFVVREAGGRALEDFPAWARPTIARALGDARGAGAARAAGPGAGGLEAAGALALLEWPNALAAPAAGAPSTPATRTAWLAVATRHRQGGADDAETRALAALAADEGALAALGARGDTARLWWRQGVDPAGFATGAARVAAERALARWRQALPRLAGGGAATQDEAAVLARAVSGAGDAFDAAAFARPARLPGTDVPPLGAYPAISPLVPAGCPDAPLEHAGLGNVARAFAADPELGARTARDWVDGAVVPHCRGLAVVLLLLEQGDPARARRFADELVAIEPGDAGALALALRAAAAQKDAPAAHLYLEQAEFWSPARGVASVAAAAVFERAQLPIEAIAAARRGLSLADGATRWAAYEALYSASRAAGRDDDARAALAAYLGELPERLRDDARRRLARPIARAGQPPPAELQPVRPGERERALGEGGARLAGLLPLGRDDASVLAARAAWLIGRDDLAGASALLDEALTSLPWAIELLAARATLAPAGSPARRDAEARLLLIGLSSEGARRRAALLAFAGLAEARGAAALAADALAEAR